MEENMIRKFESYEPRQIGFERVVDVDVWKVKVYTITNKETFGAIDILEKAIGWLPNWMGRAKTLKLPTYEMATMVVHEGRDGVWTLLNWWIGGEMMQKLTFYTDFDEPDKFEILPSDGSMACVWDMHVLTHESNSWRRHILERADAPDFNAYLGDVIEGAI